MLIGGLLVANILETADARFLMSAIQYAAILDCKKLPITIRTVLARFRGKSQITSTREHLFANLKEARDRRRMDDRLQHQPIALEPQRAHTNRVRSTPQGGEDRNKLHPMNEGKLGSRLLTIHAISAQCLRTQPAGVSFVEENDG